MIETPNLGEKNWPPKAFAISFWINIINLEESNISYIFLFFCLPFNFLKKIQIYVFLVLVQMKEIIYLKLNVIYAQQIIIIENYILNSNYQILLP